MFEHVKIESPGGFTPANRASAFDIMQGKLNTLDLFASLGVVDDEQLSQITERDRNDARSAFSAVTDPSADPEKAKRATLALRTPTSTAYAATMLQAYDWDFAAQAANIRSYIVARLIGEAEEPKNMTKDKLRALELLGKVSEVDLFTEKVKVSITQAPQAEIERRLMEKIQALEVIDVECKEHLDE